MRIQFPPERRQPPPHYTSGARQPRQTIERQAVRAIVHPDAIKIAAPAPIVAWSATSPIAPHRITFTTIRPPPGTVAVEEAPRARVRAVVHADAAYPGLPRPIVERRVSAAVAPHRIAFAAAIAPPYRTD